MQTSGEIFSLWVGSNSQQLAHHFYALQAQQFFDESEDPIEHNCIWKLYDSDGERKKPYSLTFDTEIPHLNFIRHVNHRKVLVEMEKSHMNLEHYFFPVQYKKPQASEVPEQKDKYLYQRWQSDESNYSLIDKNFVQDCDSFEHWKQIFRANSDVYEDKVRKTLEGFDMLKYITFTSDLQKSGFSQQLLFYLRDQCPKNDLHFFQLQSQEKSSFYEVSQLQSFAEMATLSDVFIKFKASIPQVKYFDAQNPFIHLAPLMNCLITPLCLKDTSQQSYLSNILTNPSRNIFDVAYTLPIIDTELRLSRITNIFDYLLEDRHEKFFEEQQKSKQEVKCEEQVLEKESMMNLLEEDTSNRISYCSDYLGLRQMVKDHPHEKIKQELYTELISEAYILKGHIKNFQKIFNPNCQLLDMKYLQGILCNYPGNKAKYNKNYVKQYGQNVGNYPFHCVMFQHQKFGDCLRDLTTCKSKNGKHELEEEWRENILTQADLYKEIKEEDND